MKNSKTWWGYIDSDIRELLEESMLLVEKVRKWDQKFTDYAFIVFPAAKAYEGFLKFMFLDLGFINSNQYKSKRFRIGRALNPSLDEEYRKTEGVYDKIVNHCGGEDVANKLWDTWKKCRNLLFHYFPDERNNISFVEAEERVNQVVSTMDLMFRACKAKFK